MKHKLIFAAASTLLAASPQAVADPTFHNLNNINPQIGGGSNEWDITLQVTGDDAYARIGSNESASNPNDEIYAIFIEDFTDTVETVTLNIRGAAQNQKAAFASVGSIEIYRVGGGSPSIKLIIEDLKIAGDLVSTSTPVGVAASLIEEIAIGGDLKTSIVANNIYDSDTRLMSVDVDGELSSSSSVIANYSGGINFVTAGNANAGLQQQNIRTIWSSSTIDNVFVYGNYNGAIGNTNSEYPTDPDLNLLNVYGGHFSTATPFSLNSLFGGVIARDFGANMSVTSSTSSLTSYLLAGRDFRSTASIYFPYPSVKGQVIINSHNVGGTPDGTVTVQGISENLTGNYHTLSDQIGGGAIGTYPYNFHRRTTDPDTIPGTSDLYERDCDPYFQEYKILAYDPGTTKNVPLDSVKISHYGPVFVDSSVDTQFVHDFRIEFKPDASPSPGTWYDRSSHFVVDYESTGSYEADPNTSRNVVIQKGPLNTNGFRAAGTWRIRPNGDKLRCAGVLNTPPTHWESANSSEDVVSGDSGDTNATDQYSWFEFRVVLEAPEGALLLQGSNGPTSSDISSWLQSPYETNADDETNIEDLELLTE